MRQKSSALGLRLTHPGLPISHQVVWDSMGEAAVGDPYAYVLCHPGIRGMLADDCHASYERVHRCRRDRAHGKAHSTPAVLLAMPWEGDTL